MAHDRRAMIRAAEKLTSRGKLEAAIKQYRKVLRATPDDTQTLNRVGDLYARLNRLDEAVEIFSQAADRFVDEGFLVKAIAILKKIIRLDPTRISVYETLADLYHRQGLRNEARSQYQVVADYFATSGESGRVRSIYEKMVELEPSNPSHRVKLAELYCEAEMIPAALDQYQLIAAFMLDHGKVDEALRVYEGAFDLSPSDLGFLTDVVLHLKDAGEPQAAERLLAGAIAKNPEAARVREVTGLVEIEPERPVADLIDEAAPSRLDEAEALFDDDEIDAEEVAAPDMPEADSDVEATAGEEISSELQIDDAMPSLVEGATPASVEEAVAADERDDEEEDVLVLDLDSTTTDLPFAVDGQVADAASQDTPAEELEIDLDELEEQLAAADVVTSEEVSLEQSAEEKAPVETVAGPALEKPSVEDVETEADEAPVEEKAPVETVAGPALEKPSLAEPGDVAEPTDEEVAREEAAEVGVQEVEAGAAETDVEDVEVVASATVDEPEADAAVEHEEVAELPDGFEVPSDEASAEVVAETVSAAELTASVDELLTEARMLVSYGLSGKAADLCERVVEIVPGHAEAYELLLGLHHEGGQVDRVAELGTVARGELGQDSAAWSAIGERLEEWGYRVGPKSIQAAEAVDEAPPLVEAEPAEAEASAPMWLDDESSAEQSFSEAQEIFGAEDEFFDLAAELEHELRQEEEEVSGEIVPQLQEQSLEEIVEGFKKGVAENLSEEDYETHYNLGIAYREMGLVDEAIGEFQLAAKAGQYLVDCCSLLGACFLEKGFPDLAIKWYERGLEAPQATEMESLGLLYELGNLYLLTGDKEVARKTFAEIYGINSNYRDVVAKLEELRTT